MCTAIISCIIYTLYTFVQNYIKCSDSCRDSEEIKENICNNNEDEPVEIIRIKAKVEEKTNTSIRSCAQQSDNRKEQNTDHLKRFCNRHMNFRSQCLCRQQNTVGKHCCDYLSNESHNKIPEIHLTKNSITDDKKVTFNEEESESKLSKPVMNSTEKSMNLPSNCSVSTISTDETTYRHIPENGMKKNNEEKPTKSLRKRDVKPRKPCRKLRKCITRIFQKFKIL